MALIANKNKVKDQNIQKMKDVIIEPSRESLLEVLCNIQRRTL